MTQDDVPETAVPSQQRKRQRRESGQTVRARKLRVFGDPSLTRNNANLEEREEKKWVHDMSTSYIPSPRDSSTSDVIAKFDDLTTREINNNSPTFTPLISTKNDIELAKEEEQKGGEEDEEGNEEETVRRANLELKNLLKRIKEKAELSCSAVPDAVLDTCSLDLNIWAVLVDDQSLIRASELMVQRSQNEALRMAMLLARASVTAAVDQSPFNAPAALSQSSTTTSSNSFLTNSTKPNTLDSSTSPTSNVGFTKLNVANSKQLGDRGMMSIRPWISGLLDLQLAGCTKVTDKSLTEVFLACGSSLEHVDLSRCPKVCGAALVALGQQCGRLKTLKLRNFSTFREWLMKRLVVRCQELEEIDLSICDKLSDESLRTIAHQCHKLRRVAIAKCKNISDVGILALSEQCGGLEELDLTRVDLEHKITDVCLLSLAERCKGLFRLILTGCDNLTDVGINWLVTGCQHLQHLNLADCTRITDVGMRAIGETCVELAWLSVANAKAISDVGVRHVALGCRQLKHVNLMNCFLLTDGHKRSFGQEGLQVLASSCTQLSFLGLDGCFRVGNNVMSVFGRSKRPIKILRIANNPTLDTKSFTGGFLRGCGATVHTLNLARCQLIGDRAVAAIARACPFLVTLILAQNILVGNSSIRALSRFCKALQILDLDSCIRITDLALLALVNGKLEPGLGRLVLKKCDHITETGVAWLSSMESLYELNVKGCNAVSLNGVKSVAGSWPHVHVRQDDAFFGIWPDDQCRAKREMDHFGKVWNSAVMIQNSFRAKVARREMALKREEYLRHWVATKLQSMWRSRKAKRYMYLKRLQRDKEVDAAILVQRQYRRRLAVRVMESKRIARHEQQCQDAAKLVQRVYRGKKARDVLYAARIIRQEYQQKCEACARQVQRIWRGRAGRQEFDLLKAARLVRQAEEDKAAANIQSVFRGRKARRAAREKQALLEAELQRREEAASCIQRMVRGKMARNSVFGEAMQREKERKAAIKLQSLFRAKKGRYAAYIRYKAALAAREERAALYIQCRWRTKSSQLSAQLLRGAKKALLEEEIAAACKVQRVFRGKQGRQLAFEMRDVIESKIRRLEDLESWAAILVQTKFRQRLGMKRAAVQREKKMRRWKEMWNEKENRAFFYNQDTGEIRYRRPQVLLELLPRPFCLNCEYYEAAMECSNCAEFYCQECFAAVHYGGKRKHHTFRAMFDMYGHRVDYGEGEWPSLWPSEIEQDEFSGWRPVVGADLVGIANAAEEDILATDWAKYHDTENDLAYYWSESLQVSQYELPAGYATPRVSSRQNLATPDPDWTQYWDDTEERPFYYNSTTEESTYDRPAAYRTPREEEEEIGGAGSGVEARSTTWSKRVNAGTGQIFYHNSETGRSVFERPIAYESPRNNEEHDEQLQSDDQHTHKKIPWIRSYNDEQLQYEYHHKVSGKVQFERPPGFESPRADTWTLYFDESTGREFYFNDVMNVSQYVRPPEYETPRPEGFEEGNGAWVRYVFENQIMYENIETGEIQNERPSDFYVDDTGEVVDTEISEEEKGKEEKSEEEGKDAAQEETEVVDIVNEDWSEEGCREFFTKFRDELLHLPSYISQFLRPEQYAVGVAVCEELGLNVKMQGFGSERKIVVVRIVESDDEDDDDDGEEAGEEGQENGAAT